MKPRVGTLNGIYYIVLADLVGSTKSGAQLGNSALAARTQTFIGAAHKALENARKASSNSGFFIKSVGDGALLLFTYFPDVVQWQMEFEGVLHLAAPNDEPLRARVCVHAGEVRYVGSDVNALAINQVFKMEKHVGAGEIVLTDVAHKLAAPSLYPKQCQFERCRSVRLEGYGSPVKLHRLVIKADLAFLIDKTARKPATGS